MSVSALRTRREAASGFRDRQPQELIAEIETGSQALSDTAHGWRAIWPSGRALTAAEATVEGLSRLVAELRQRMAENR